MARARAILLSFCLGMMPLAAMARPAGDPLERPALVGPRAQSALILDVAASGKRLLAVGERGVVLVSDDHGESWQQRQVPVSVTLTAAAFATDGRVWIAGHSGVVLRSKDGGDTWQRMLEGSRAAELALTSAKQSGNADLLANAELLVKDGPDKPFFGILTDRRGVTVYGAYNLVFHTLDDGQTWQPWLGRVDNPMGLHLYGVVRTLTGHFVAAGEQGTLYRSAGTEFNLGAVRSPYEGSFFGLLDAGDEGLFAYGLLGNLYRSMDDGQTWTPCDTGTGATISDLAKQPGGGLLLATVSGELRRSLRADCAFEPVALEVQLPIAVVLALGDDQVILGGVGGLRRVSLGQSGSGAH